MNEISSQRGFFVVAKFALSDRVRFLLQRYWLAFVFCVLQGALLVIQSVSLKTGYNPHQLIRITQQILTLIAVCYGIQRYRPVPGRPWHWLLAWSVLSLLHGLLPLFVDAQSSLHKSLGFGVTISLLGYCIAITRRRTLARNPVLWLDITIICLGCSLFELRYLLIVWWDQIDSANTNFWVLLWPPLVRLSLLAGALSIVLTARRNSVLLSLLTLALLAMVLGDLLWLNFHGPQLHMPSTAHDGRWYVFAWLSSTLVGVAALLPQMGHLADPGLSAYPAWGRWRVALIFIAIAAPMYVLGSLPAPLSEHPESQLLLGVAIVMETILITRCYVAIVGARLARIELLHRIDYDALTGLRNDHSLRTLAARQAEPLTPYCLALLTIDRFSQINNTWGHAIGDRLLQAVTHILQRHDEPHLRLFRTAEAEFALYQSQTDERSGVTLLRKILTEIGRPLQLGGQRFYLQASIGLSFNEQPESRSIDDVLREADIALYRAKGRGGNAIVVFDEAMREEIAERQRLLAAMRQGIWHEFSVVYQPVVQFDSGNVSFYQVLLRWTSAEFGSVSPKRFLPLAEEAGLIGEMTLWVMTQAFIELSRAPPTLCLLVTITAHDLRDKSIVGLLDWLHAEYRVRPERLMLELTESIMIEDVENVLPLLRERGHQIVINHFGSGHSSLNSLTSLPVDAVKLAEPFIAQIEQNTHQRRLCQSMIALCHQSGLQVIAKGVETESQRDLLHAMDCDFVQGWLYGFPQSKPIRE